MNDCKLCVHNPVCDLWRSQECQDAALYSDTEDGCDLFIEKRRWIPVMERLPEDDLPKDSRVKQIKVLVAYKTNGRWVERTQIRVKGYWHGEPDKWDWAKTSDPISHWMPMPEVPMEV